jgi:hypothetical protein
MGPEDNILSTNGHQWIDPKEEDKWVP